jgi:anaerobic ribonucleoside-triphosphate reductase activating protein
MSDRYFIDYSLKNGLGNPSIDLYLKGCDKPVKCKNCHNPELQEKPTDHFKFKNIRKEIDNQIKEFKNYHDQLYITYLGGEPLTSYNLGITFVISQHIKFKYKNAYNILYSWRTIEQIKKEGIQKSLRYIDYGILGAYKKELHQENMLPVSSNQYIYDFNKDKKIKPIKLYSRKDD